MRLWSLHPRHLDPQGLVALWREGLLARHVLHGLTRGYRNHPQLDRFKAHPQPRRAIDAYLAVVQEDASARGYNFDRSKLGRIHRVAAIAVERGQLEHERMHLLAKLVLRSTPCTNAGATPRSACIRCSNRSKAVSRPGNVHRRFA